MKKEDKTNVMRILEAEKISFKAHEYEVSDGRIDGVSIAEKLNQPQDRVFKTLITQGASKEYFVFCLPVNCELDLKKAARAVGEKSVEMIPVAEINKVSGYIRGGCSPIGMKRKFTTVFEEAAFLYDSIMLSAGKIGKQIEISPEDIIQLTESKTADIIKRKG